jgi:hypothetical protein
MLCPIRYGLLVYPNAMDPDRDSPLCKGPLLDDVATLSDVTAGAIELQMMADATPFVVSAAACDTLLAPCPAGPCGSSPCVHGSQCENLVTEEYHCRCPSDFTGKHSHGR